MAKANAPNEEKILKKSAALKQVCTTDFVGSLFNALTYATANQQATKIEEVDSVIEMAP
jgi:hypothetical protein